MQKEQLEFGKGSFVGAIQTDPTFFDLTVRDQALVLGYSDACPVALDLTDPANTEPGRGPESMLLRYGEVNSWFTQIGQLVAAVNPDLHAQMLEPLPREADEPIGMHEPKSVPASNYTHIAPMGTLTGYALPRIFVEEVTGNGQDTIKSEAQDRMARAMTIVTEAATAAQTPLALLALVAEGLVVAGDIEASRIMKHIFAKGWLEEHNGRKAMAAFKTLVAQSAPHVQQAYNQLSAGEKAKLA